MNLNPNNSGRRFGPSALCFALLVGFANRGLAVPPADESYEDDFFNNVSAIASGTSYTQDGLAYAAFDGASSHAANFWIVNSVVDSLLDDGDNAFGVNLTGATTPDELRISSVFGDEFDLVSMSMDADGNGLSAETEYTISGYRDGVQVATDSVDFTSSDFSGSITFSSDGGATGAGGTLTFGSDWDNIDEIRFVANGIVGIIAPMIDDIDFENPILPNASPTVSISDATLSYTEGDSSAQIDSAGEVSDSDGDPDWNGGTLEIQITVNGEADDFISVSDNDFDATLITVSGSNIFSNGVDVGDVSASGGVVTGGTKLTITFDADATNGIVQETLRSVRYFSISENPSELSRTVTVTARDSFAASSSDTRTISVDSINDSPSVATNTGSSLSEGETDVVASSELSANDLDDSGTGLVFTVTTDVSNGQLFLDTNSNGANDGASEQVDISESFTQSDIENSRLKYAHDGGETTSDSFVFTLADGGEDGVSPLTGRTFNFTINPLNDDPVAGADTIERISNQDVKVKVSVLLSNDSDADSSTLSITGVGSALPGGASVTLSNGWILYSAGGSSNAGSFTYSLSDGSGGDATGTVTVGIKMETSQSRNISGISNLGGGVYRITFFGIPGRDYNVQYTTNLSEPITWTNLGSATASALGIIQYDDTSGDGSRFYRTVFP